MLEIIYVGDKFEMLVTIDLIYKFSSAFPVMLCILVCLISVNKVHLITFFQTVLDEGKKIKGFRRSQY